MQLYIKSSPKLLSEATDQIPINQKNKEKYKNKIEIS